MKKVIGVELVAVMADENGDEEYVYLDGVPKDQKEKLEEHLLLYELMEHIDLAKKKLGDWEPIVRAVDRAAALIP